MVRDRRHERSARRPGGAHKENAVKATPTRYRRMNRQIDKNTKFARRAARAKPAATAQKKSKDTPPVVNLVDLFDVACPDNVVDAASPDVAHYISEWLETCRKTGTPAVVGVDCEGTRTSPPALVQIAIPGLILFDFPSARSPRALCDTVKSLLQDDTVTKVFVQGREDLRSMRCNVAGIHDVGRQAERMLGSSKGNNVGLAGCAALAFPGVQFEKPKMKEWFIAMERGQKPRSFKDLSRDKSDYAAADAWVTLQMYHLLQTHNAVGAERPNLPTSIQTMRCKKERGHASIAWCAGRINAAAAADPVLALLRSSGPSRDDTSSLSGESINVAAATDPVLPLLRPSGSAGDDSSASAPPKEWWIIVFATVAGAITGTH